MTLEAIQCWLMVRKYKYNSAIDAGIRYRFWFRIVKKGAQGAVWREGAATCENWGRRGLETGKEAADCWYGVALMIPTL